MEERWNWSIQAEDAPGKGACNIFESEEEDDDWEESEELEEGSSGGIPLTGV